MFSYNVNVESLSTMPSADTWDTLPEFGIEIGETQNPLNRIDYRRPRHQHTSVNVKVDALRRQGQQNLCRCADVSGHGEGGWLPSMLYAIGSFKDVAHLSAHGYLKTLLTFIARSEIRRCSGSCKCDIVFSVQAETYCEHILCDADALVDAQFSETAWGEQHECMNDIRHLCQIRIFASRVIEKRPV